MEDEKPFGKLPVSVVRNDAFFACLDSFLNSELYADFSSKIHEHKQVIEKHDVSYRVLSHWDSQGLIECERNADTGWRKFNLVEALWLFIIQELRAFGVNLESIHKVKTCFFEEGTGKALPLIQFYLVFALQLGRPIYLVVLPDGHTECLDYGQYKTALALELLNTHIIICLNELLSKLKVHAKKVVYPLETELNLEMHQLFEKIKDADFDTATIHRKDGKIDRVELKSQKNPRNRVHDALNEGDNLDITIKKRNGRIICCNSTTIEKV